jgi:O-antigen/teichoic acid export membrane protein
MSRPFLSEDPEVVTENVPGEGLPDASVDYAHLRTVAKGGTIILGGKIFSSMCRLVLVILLARLLAVEHYGMYNLGLTVAEIVAGLAALGLGKALVRYIPLFRSRGEQAAVLGTLQVCVGVPTALSILLAIGLYSLAQPIAQHLLHEPRMASLLRLVSFLVPLLTLDDMVAAATRGFKKMHYTTIAQLIAHPSVKLGLMGGIAFFGLTAARALTAAAVAQIVATGLILYFLSKLAPLDFPWQPAQRRSKELLRFSSPVYLSSLLNKFGIHLQVLLLAGFANVYSVGIFVLARNVAVIGRLFQRSVSMSSAPIFSELSSQEKRGELARLYQTANRWTFSLNLPMFLILLIFPGEILSFFGDSYASGVVVLVLLALRSLILAVTGTSGALLNMTGHTIWRLVNSIVRLVLSLGLGLLLIPRWGIVGAAAAVLIGDATARILCLVEVFVLLRIWPYNRGFWKPLVAGLVTVPIVFALSQFVFIESRPIHGAVLMIALLFVYFAANLLLGLPQEERMMLRDLRRRASTALAAL